MGGRGATITRKIKVPVKDAIIGGELAYKRMKSHPNFKMPKKPRLFGDVKTADLEMLVDYVIEAAATLVSPPPTRAESDEFACVDLAEALRKQLKPELLKRLGA